MRTRWQCWQVKSLWPFVPTLALAQRQLLVPLYSDDPFERERERDDLSLPSPHEFHGVKQLKSALSISLFCVSGWGREKMLLTKTNFISKQKAGTKPQTCNSNTARVFISSFINVFGWQESSQSSTNRSCLYYFSQISTYMSLVYK